MPDRSSRPARGGGGSPRRRSRAPRRCVPTAMYNAARWRRPASRCGSEPSRSTSSRCANAAAIVEPRASTPASARWASASASASPTCCAAAIAACSADRARSISPSRRRARPRIANARLTPSWSPSDRHWSTRAVASTATRRRIALERRLRARRTRRTGPLRSWVRRCRTSNDVRRPGTIGGCSRYGHPPWKPRSPTSPPFGRHDGDRWHWPRSSASSCAATWRAQCGHAGSRPTPRAC